MPGNPNVANIKNQSIVGILVGLCLFPVARLIAAETGATLDAGSATIRLSNGDFIAGKLVDSSEAKSFAWQSPIFTGPIQFPLNRINTVNFPIPAKLPQPGGDYGFELAGGDMVFGTLKTFTGDDVELEVPGQGVLHINQSIIRRIYRWNSGAELIYFGPGGLTGWKQSIASAWRDEAGHLVSSQAGAVVSREFAIPPQVRMELELAWNKKPDFELSLGDTPPLNAFRFEVLENDLVVACESDSEADVKSIKQVKSGADSLQLQLLLDQDKKRLLVYAPNGDLLADLKLEGKKPTSFNKLQLTNKVGNIRLERLRISRWTGELPRAVETNKARVHLTDGAFVYGRIKSYDAASHEFVVNDGTNDQKLAENRVQDVILASENPATTPTLRVAQLNGLQFSGELLKVEKETVWVTCAGIREPLSAPVSNLHSIAILSPVSETTKPAGRIGRLEADGTVVQGKLVDAIEGDTSCLVWQPTYGIAGVPLVRGANARIDYRPMAAVVAATQSEPAMPQPQVQVRLGGFAGQVQNLIGGVPQPAPKVRVKPKTATTVLHLRSGDTIPCTVTGIDEEGVTFTSKVSDTTFIKHESIKVLELESEAPPVKIAKAKRERLLVLPRMQRGNPPTQLIRSVNGDYLRGRLVAMDDKELRVELRLEEKTIPRDTVTRIIWLHADEITGGEARKSTIVPSTQSRVQAIPSSGNRLTFFAEQFEGKILSGKSDVLGNCHVDVTNVDLLLIGPAIEQAASSLAFHQWRLKHASDPLGSDGESDAGGGEDGRDSSLVGKDAPTIELDLLDGTKFKLADHKSKIVILDFWASWCGPCLQAMPLVDKVAHEFADQGVELIAINLEETPEKVKAALERLKLKTTVALDQNGRVAERYGVTSIPQTVIINREGKVARLFVGGGPRFDEQIRTALKAVLSE